MKILLAEDSRSYVALLKARLSKIGHEVITAENGKIAVDIFIKTAPDLVLMDINMPVVNGFEATAQIREHETKHGWSWTPVVFLTASDTPDNLVTAIEAGADDFLSKMMPEPVLHAKINAMGRIADKNKDLQLSRLKYRNLFDHMSNGFALHEMIFDESGKPINYRFIEVNPAFEKMTGFAMDKVVGKTVLDVMPDTESYWIKNYGEVVLTGEPCTFESFAKQINRWYKVTAYRPEIGRFAVTVEDVTELKLAQKELEHVAHYDILTDLPNRALFAQRLALELDYAKRQGTMLAVGYMDLDKFKPVNDTYGHEVGDGLLREVAKRLKSASRSVDSVSRLGGDEFALLVSKYKTQVELDGHLNRIITAIAQPYTISGHDINISMSLGVAIYPTDHTEADVLLRLADHALYDAKKAGGNQYSMFVDN